MTAHTKHSFWHRAVLMVIIVITSTHPFESAQPRQGVHAQVPAYTTPRDVQNRITNATALGGRASAAPSCATGVGVGGTNNSTIALTVGGHGCVVVKYITGGVEEYETFNYSGADQFWTVPSDVTSASFYLLGAGGGGSTYSTFADGGGGGYAAGSSAVTAAQVFTVIVGQSGGGDTGVSGTRTNCLHSPLKYGGGGQGGSCLYSGYPPSSLYYSSGGGRSAIRLSNGTEIATCHIGGPKSCALPKQHPT